MLLKYWGQSMNLTTTNATTKWREWQNINSAHDMSIHWDVIVNEQNCFVEAEQMFIFVTSQEKKKPVVVPLPGLLAVNKLKLCE